MTEYKIQNMKVKSSFLIFNFSLLILLSSCGIYTNYQRPDLQTDNLFGEGVETADTANLADLYWWEIFTDPDLQELIKTGLENNTDLQIAYLRITESKAALQSAKLAYLPSLSLNPQGTISSFDGAKASKSYQLPVDASWEIDIFGKLTNAQKKQRAALEQSEAYRQAVQTQLVASIANSYYTLLMLDSQLTISEQTAANWKENVQMMNALKKAGQTNEASVAQAEANSLAVDASLLDLKQQIIEVENALSAMLGETPHTITRGSLSGQTFPEETAVGIPLRILSNRPDVKSAEASLAQAFYATNEARSAFYPSLTLSGSAGWVNNGGGIVSNPGALLLQAVGSLSQPLFNKGKNKANLKIAQAQQEEAKLTFRQTLLDAGAEVNNALTQCQIAREKVSIYQKQVDRLETAVQSTRLLMQHSNTTYLEVLTAQETLLQAELTQVSNRFNEIQGIISLYQALGGGWQ